MPSEHPAPADADGQAPSAEGSDPPAAPHSSHPPPADAGSTESKETKRGRFESRLPSLIRRGIEKSIEAGLYTFEKSVETGDAVREVFSDVKIPDVASAVGKALQEAKLPREIAGAVLSQIDEAKNDVVRIVAREVRDFLEATDLAGEIKAALTSLSFEVRTEVRFIPNDAGTGVRADVRARSRVKRTTAPQGRSRARRHKPEGEEPEPEES